MNRGTVEKVCEAKLVSVSREGWILVDHNGLILASAKSKKERVAWQKIHDDFWSMRRKKVMERDGFRCVYCSSPFRLEVDHIKNRSVGGTHNMTNLQVLCNFCHMSKTNLQGAWKPAR